MSQHNTREFNYFNKNGKRAYYSYNNELYAATFPENWAQTHHPSTGPGNCSHCSNIGMWNGVFLGYCSNCATDIYKGCRGIGLFCYGIETDFLGIISKTQQKYHSIFDTYMKNVSLDNIGDTELYDTRIVHYPTLLKNERPTLEKYTQYSVTYVSESSEEPEKIAELCYSSDTDTNTDTEEKCFGYNYDSGYGSNFNGGYDSY